MTTPEVYARVINGQITEYPVYYSSIIARGDPLTEYTPVTYGAAPSITAYQQLEESIQVIGNTVLVSYEAVDLPFESLLTLAWGADTYEGISDITTPPAISSIDPLLVQTIENTASSLVGDILDVFAATKNYSSITSACSYFNSSIPEFNADGQAAVYCRDLTWSYLYTYMGKLTAGLLPIPSSFDDVLNNLPVLSWAVAPTYTGATTLIPGTSNTFTITNYMAGAYYQATAKYGIVSISGDTVTYTAGSAGSDVLYINNVAINLTIAYPAPTISGPSSVAVGSTTTYTISNYYSGNTYSVTATTGTVSISGNTITYVSPTAAGSGGFTCNGVSVAISYS